MIHRDDEDGPRGIESCPERLDAPAYAQGRLAPESAQRFRAHVEGCPRCLDDLRDAEAVLELLQSSAPPRGDVDLVARVLDGIDRAAAAQRSRRFRRFGALAAAAAAVFAAVWLPWLLRTAPRDAGPAAERAAAWLARAQDASGGFSAERWGGESAYDVGLTGLAALAFLASRGSADLAATRALEFLVRSQSADGRFGPDVAGAPYNHGIATVALLEAHAARRDGRLREPIDGALAYILRAQTLRGGWGYLGDAAADANAAATVWPLQALLIARAQGFYGLDSAIRGGFDYFARVCDERGRLGYRRPGEFQAAPEALSAMGALCLLLAPDNPGFSPTARGRLFDEITRASVPSNAGRDLYRDFFVASVLEALGPGRRGRFSSEARRALAEAQVPAGPARGSFDPNDAWSPAGGRVYSTAVAALILEADRRAERLRAVFGPNG